MLDDPQPRRLDLTGVAGTIVCCAFWGGNAVAVKLAVPHLPPLGCAAIRFVIGLPIVAIVCLRIGHSVAVRRSFWWLLGVHGLLTAAQIGTFNWGASHSLAGRSSVFINIHPLIVAPLAWYVLGERLGGRGLAGLGAAALGVLVLLAEPLRTGGGLAGDFVVLGSGVIFAVQTIAQKKTFPLIPPTTLLFWQTVLAAPICLTYSLIFEGLDAYHFPAQAIWGVLYQGVAVSGVCFSLWLLLLRSYPAGQLATVAFVTPLFGVGFGHFWQQDPLTPSLIASGVLVGLGIFLVASDRTAHALPADLALPGEDAP
ncbi:MAG TPA: DMT family transporter [Isosphaeraceae bacterium]|nr:DMT family transporter [Isosphaeraceae bacterium]